MTITLSKTIVIIILVCLVLITICDIAIWILKIYQKRLDKIESKYEIAIGKYDEELNKTNRTFLAGKGLKGQQGEYLRILAENDEDFNKKLEEWKKQNWEYNPLRGEE